MPVEEKGVGLEGAVFSTKALQKFIACLVARPSPVLLDLGPVVGSNIAFFGERLGCKIHVEDLYSDLDRHVRAGTLGSLPEFIRRKLTLADSSVDGILCWDLMDYLDRAAAQAAAGELTRVLRTNGALLGFFHATAQDDPCYVKYVVVDESTLGHREYPAAQARRGGLQNRDVIRLFGGLRVSDSFLLKSHVREILFRKPAYLAGAGGRESRS